MCDRLSALFGIMLKQSRTECMSFSFLICRLAYRKNKNTAEQNAGKADIFPAFQEKLLTEITAHE